jgi:large subunit ribosomal protein L13
MATRVPKIAELEERWLVVDAAGQTLGRLASHVATRLRGKHRPTFTPHMDTGDHVIVVNAAQVKVTGQKSHQKLYRRHTGTPGGLKEVPLERLLERYPERVIEAAVHGMLPKNRLGRKIIRKLKVYAGPEHPHQAQRPVTEDLSGRS